MESAILKDPSLPVRDNVETQSGTGENRKNIVKAKKGKRNSSRLSGAYSRSITFAASLSHHSDSSTSGEFWLPEFQPSPPRSPERPSSPAGFRRDRWNRKSQAVLPELPTKVPSSLNLTIQVLHSAAPTRPPCQCPVCSHVEKTTLLSRKLDRVEDTTELVAHGRDKFTMYDKTRPWRRVHVQHCTNRRPLDRRMPKVVTARNEVANKVYSQKRMVPGKVIKDMKHNKNKERRHCKICDT